MNSAVSVVANDVYNTPRDRTPSPMSGPGLRRMSSQQRESSGPRRSKDVGFGNNAAGMARLSPPAFIHQIVWDIEAAISPHKRCRCSLCPIYHFDSAVKQIQRSKAIEGN